MDVNSVSYYYKEFNFDEYFDIIIIALIFFVVIIISIACTCFLKKRKNKKSKENKKSIVISPVARKTSIDDKINEKNIDKEKEQNTFNASYSEEKVSLEKNDEASLFKEQSNRTDSFINTYPTLPSVYVSREIPINTDYTNFGVTNNNLNNTTFINNTLTYQLQNPSLSRNVNVNNLSVHLDYPQNYSFMSISNQNQVLLPSYEDINRNTIDTSQQQPQQSFTTITTTSYNEEDNNDCNILPSYSQLVHQHSSSNLTSKSENEDHVVYLNEKHCK